MDKHLAFSLESGDVYEMLIYFLQKHFDPKIQSEGRWCDPDDGFEEFESNLYTIDAMKEILKDIKKHVRSLRDDPDDEYVEEIKSWYAENMYVAPRFTDVHSAVRFYERFIFLTEDMMMYRDDYDYFVISGP